MKSALNIPTHKTEAIFTINQMFIKLLGIAFLEGADMLVMGFDSGKNK